MFADVTQVETLQGIAALMNIVVLPVLSFAVKKLWAMDVRLVRVEDKLDAEKLALAVVQKLKA